MPGHSVSLQVLGTFILWFGWFGFNAGSSLLMKDNIYSSEIGTVCAVNTFLSSSASCITALLTRMILTRMKEGHVVFDLHAAMNGTLTGLVAIASACGTVEPWAALVIGAVSGPLYIGSSNLLLYLKLDDVVDAAPVHFFGGTWGAIAVGLLSSPDLVGKVTGRSDFPGFFYSLAEGHADARLLACQVCGLLFVIGWNLAMMVPFFLILNSIGWLRSDAVEEIVGLDLLYNEMDQDDNSEGSDAGMRDEYLQAYEDYRLKKLKKGPDDGSRRSSVGTRSRKSGASVGGSSAQS